MEYALSNQECEVNKCTAQCKMIHAATEKPTSQPVLGSLFQDNKNYKGKRMQIDRHVISVQRSEVRSKVHRHYQQRQCISFLANKYCSMTKKRAQTRKYESVPHQRPLVPRSELSSTHLVERDLCFGVQ